MKNYLILVIIFATFTGCSQTYELDQKFVLESTYNFQIKRAKVDSNEPMTKDLATLTDVTAKFEEYKSNIKVTWEYGETKPSGPSELISQIGPEYYDLININKGILIEILITKNGKYLSLKNFADLKAQLEKKMLNMYMDENLSIDSSTMVKVLEMIRPTMETEDALIGTYFGEVFVYFNSLQETLTDEMEYSTVYPFPLGGGDIPFNGKYKIVSDNDDILKFEYKAKGDEKELNRIMRDFIKNMAEQANDKVEDKDIPNMSYDSESIFIYDKNKGHLSKATLNNTIKFDGGYQSQLIEITINE